MTDPLSALGMTAFAFLNGFMQTEQGKKFIESIVGKLGEKVTEAGLGKIGELKRKIVAKLRGNPKAEAAIVRAEKGDKEAIEDVAYHLREAMREDSEFATEIQQIAQEIINIGKIERPNIQNVYDGQGQMITGDSATVYQVGPNSTLHIGHKPD